MLAGTPGTIVKRGGDPFVHFAAILDAADIRIANLECVVAVGGSAEADKPYTFRAHPRTLRVLERHFDAMSLANNHTGDYGPNAFEEMLNLFEGRGIHYFGGGRDLASAHAPLVIERKGLRIALLGYDEFFPRSFEADADKPGIAWSEDEQVRLDIVDARARLRRRRHRHSFHALGWEAGVSPVRANANWLA
ncbi:MAG: CapA family protein [Burkholderiales bacterium]